MRCLIAIMRDLTGLTGNLPPLPAILPDMRAPVIRVGGRRSPLGPRGMGDLQDRCGDLLTVSRIEGPPHSVQKHLGNMGFHMVARNLLLSQLRRNLCLAPKLVPAEIGRSRRVNACSTAVSLSMVSPSVLSDKHIGKRESR
jgi:hypothetical protein